MMTILAMPSYKYRAKVLRVIDGDTFVAQVDLGFNVHIVETFRLMGADAPEMRGDDAPKGKVAADYVRTVVEGREVVVETHKTGKYGRWLAKVTLQDGTDLGSMLIAKGLVRPLL